MKSLTDCDVTILKSDIDDTAPQQSPLSYEYEIAHYEGVLNEKADIFFEAWKLNGIERTKENEKLFSHGFRMAWRHLRQSFPANF